MDRREYIRQTSLYLGYSLSAGTIASLLSSCQKDAKLTWEPQFLDNHQANTIAEIAETICPKTKTPGAKELGVPQFIDKMVKEVMSKEDQNEFTKGIEELDDRCKKEFGKNFIECDKRSREQILTQWDKESPHFPANLWGIVLEEKPAPITFFRKVKSLVLMGYFTSEKIGKEVLVYDPVPGKYLACIPYKGENNWTE
ncbi:gluconate 2-dehydrogenase subunit 3 family protein [Aquirufa sp. ROCK-SH2]